MPMRTPCFIKHLRCDHPQRYRAEQDDKVIIIHRGVDEERHRIECHQPCGQQCPGFISRRKCMAQPIAKVNRSRTQQERKPANEIDCQRRPASPRCLPRQVQNHIDIVGCLGNAHVRKGIQHMDVFVIVDVHPGCKQRSQEIVKWRLAAFMLPGGGNARPLHGQAMMGDDFTHHRIVPHLIRRLENGRSKAIDDSQQQIGQQQEQNAALACEKDTECLTTCFCHDMQISGL